MTIRGWILTLVVICGGFESPPGLAAPGDLDPTFADAGRLRLGIESAHRNTCFDIAEQADGKLVVVGECRAGTYNEFVLFRYNTDGSLDPSFGDNGMVLTSFDWNAESAVSVAIQPDGKILAAGTGNSRILVARYLPDGTLDPSWDGDGRANFSSSPNELRAYAMALQTNGKVVVAGGQEIGFVDHFAVVRFNSNGSRDTSFDGDGLVTTSFPDKAYAAAVTIQRDGKILAVGRAELLDQNDHVALVRYLDNGTLDTTFNLDGIATVLEESYGLDVTLQKGILAQFDQIVVAGGDGFSLYRFNLDGSLDFSFGTNGKAVMSGNFSGATGVRILYSNGTASRIIATSNEPTPDLMVVGQFLMNGTRDTAFGGGDGNVTTSPGPGGGRANKLTLASGKIAVVGFASQPVTGWDFAVVRHNADGSLDTSFDGDGIRLDDAGGLVAVCRGAAVQADGKLVFAGASKSAVGDDDFAVVRCNADGTLDPSFGEDGRVSTPVSAGEDVINEVAIQPDGKIVVVGESRNGSDTEVTLARYNPDGSLDTTFSGDGIEITPGGPKLDTGRALVLQPDGKIVVAGLSMVAELPNLAVLRYLPNGTLDYVVRSALGFDAAAANAIVLQPDGKVFAAGGAWSNGIGFFAGVRLLPNGSFDPSFDGDGKVFTSVGTTYDLVQAALLLGDGRIVVAGTTQEGTFYDVAVVCYNPDGSLAQSFDGDGIATFNWGSESDYGTALGLQPNGKIVVAGSVTVQTNNDFALLRLQDDGSLDPSYGTEGKVVVDLDGRSPDIGLAVAIDADGNAVVAGDAGGLFGVIRVLGDQPTSDIGDFVSPVGWRLGMPWPNPMREGASIGFHLAAPGTVVMTIFDVRGRLIRALAPERRFEPGTHFMLWDGRNDGGVPVASGVYVLRANRGGQVQTRRITVMR